MGFEMAEQSRQADKNGVLTVERNTKTLRQLALEKLRQAILDFHFMPGERLIERDLCEQLGVSRSVVREVVRHLEAEGIVEMIPNRGPAVSRIDPDKIEQIYEIRTMLESMAAAACARCAGADTKQLLGEVIDSIDAAFRGRDTSEILEQTTEFYRQLFLCGGKRVAWDVVHSLNARINHLRALTISSATRHGEAISEMKAIHQAVYDGDAQAAETAAKNHIYSVARIAHMYLECWDEYFCKKL